MDPKGDPVTQRLDEALASTDGITLDFDRFEDARRFRMRIYARRRALAAKSRASGGNGLIAYDNLIVRIVPPATLVIEPSRPIPAAQPLPPAFPDDPDDNPIIRPTR